MSEFNKEAVRDIAYGLAGKGKFNVEQFVYDGCGKKGLGYCCKEKFDGIFTKKEMELLEKSSSINEDAFNIKNLETNLIVINCYPENTFLNDVDNILSCNRRKLVSERLNADYVLRRCLEIKKNYYEIEIRKIETDAESKKADFLKKKTGIQYQLEASGI